MDRILTTVKPKITYKLAAGLIPDSLIASPAKSASPLLPIALLKPKADPIRRSSLQSTCLTACSASTHPPRMSTAQAANAART